MPVTAVQRLVNLAQRLGVSVQSLALATNTSLDRLNNGGLTELITLLLNEEQDDGNFEQAAYLTATIVDNATIHPCGITLRLAGDVSGRMMVIINADTQVSVLTVQRAFDAPYKFLAKDTIEPFGGGSYLFTVDTTALNVNDLCEAVHRLNRANSGDYHLLITSSLLADLARHAQLRPV